MAQLLGAKPPKIAGFSYIRPLGSGGFSEVFLYEQNTPRRLVAVKVLLSGNLSREQIQSFYTEINLLARLGAHPAIVSIYQADITADGRPYLVMEYCPIGLADRYRREIIPIAEVLDLGVRLSSALETIHSSGLVHRDIKPSNVLINSFGTPVLADFGIAIAQAKADDYEVALSIPWSAPEVIRQETSGTVSSEIWSLAATLYSFLAGKSPFELGDSAENTPEKLSGRIRKAKYSPIVRSDLPAELNLLLSKAMSLDPSLRPESALQFGLSLQRLQQQLGLEITNFEQPSQVWHWSASSLAQESDTGRESDSTQLGSPRQLNDSTQPGVSTQPGSENYQTSSSELSATETRAKLKQKRVDRLAELDSSKAKKTKPTINAAQRAKGGTQTTWGSWRQNWGKLLLAFGAGIATMLVLTNML